MIYDFSVYHNKLKVGFFDNTSTNLTINWLQPKKVQIKIYQGCYCSKIIIDKKIIDKFFQNKFFIFKAYEVDAGVLALVSTIKYIRAMIFIRNKNEIYKLSDHGWEKIDINESVYEESKTYYFKNRLNIYQTTSKNKKIIFFLHGGPRDYINYGVNEFSSYFLKNNYDVLTINYPVNWKNKVKKIGGITDIDYINKLIDQFCKNSAKIYEEVLVFGESYGGYLASIVTSSYVDKVVMLGGFVSIDYQKLASSERNLVCNYINESALDFKIKKLDINKQYYFFFGKNDYRVPLGQVALIPNEDNIHIKILEMGHYLSNYAEFSMFYKELDISLNKWEEKYDDKTGAEK